MTLMAAAKLNVLLDGHCNVNMQLGGRIRSCVDTQLLHGEGCICNRCPGQVRVRLHPLPHPRHTSHLRVRPGMSRQRSTRARRRYTGFGLAGKWEDLNCVAHFRFDVDAYLARAGSRYKTVEARAPALPLPRVRPAHLGSRRGRLPGTLGQPVQGS